MNIEVAGNLEPRAPLHRSVRMTAKIPVGSRTGSRTPRHAGTPERIVLRRRGNRRNKNGLAKTAFFFDEAVNL